MGERWLPVPGYEGFYEVSDLGRVRSLDRVDSLGRSRPGRILRPSVSPANRRTVQLCVDGVIVRRYISSLVLEAFVGPRPLDFEACHNDGNTLDDSLSNVRWDTRSENKLDMARHGTNPRSNRTHCPLDHELVPANCKPSSLPKRQCLACHRGRAALVRAQRAGRTVTLKELADARYRQLIMSGTV